MLKSGRHDGVCLFKFIGRGGGVQNSEFCANARSRASLRASSEFCIAAWCHMHTHGRGTCSCVPARIRKSASARPELGSKLSTNVRIRFISLSMGASTRSCVWQCFLDLCLAPCAPCHIRVCLRLAFLPFSPTSPTQQHVTRAAHPSFTVVCFTTWLQCLHNGCPWPPRNCC